MDRNLDIDDFERLLKDRSEEFKMYPTKRVWHSIYNNIHPGKKWPSIAMCIVLISVLLLVGYLNTSETNSSFTTNKTITTTTNISLLNNLPIATFYNPLVAISSSNNQSTVTVFSEKFDVTNIENMTSTSHTNAAIKNPNSVASSNTQITVKNGHSITAGNIISVHNGPISFLSEIVSPNKNVVSHSSTHINTAKALHGFVADKYVSVFPTPDNFTEANELAKTTFITSDQVNKLFVNTINNDENKTVDLIDGNTINSNEIIGSTDGKLLIENNNLVVLKQEVIATKKAVINKEAIDHASSRVTSSDKEIAASVKPLILSDEDKAWVENYALYNRPVPKKWAGKLGWQFYFTPSVVYRSIHNIVPNSEDINTEVSQHPSFGLEIGTGIIYPIFKGVKVRTGLQLNFTRYNTDAFENSHPVATTITLKDNDQFYQSARTSPFSNNGGITPVKLHHDTYQVSIPMGADFKILGNDNVQWNVGASIQPTYVFGGESYLISSDKRNFIKESSLINRWNVNAGFETFVSFKVDGFTLQLGPQFRKQLFTTNSSQYTIQEKLTNYGIKFGITKIIK